MLLQSSGIVLTALTEVDSWVACGAVEGSGSEVVRRVGWDGLLDCIAGCLIQTMMAPGPEAGV